MLINLANTSTTIHPGKIISSIFTKAQTLQIQQGQILLTIAGDLEDYLLSKGETIELPANRLIVIEVMHTQLNEGFIAQFNEKQPSATSNKPYGNFLTARISALQHLFSARKLA